MIKRHSLEVTLILFAGAVLPVSNLSERQNDNIASAGLNFKAFASN